MPKKESLPNAPITAFERGRLRWFEVYGSMGMNSNRMFILCVLQAVAITSMAIALWIMMPLKSVEGYFIDVDSQGKVEATPKAQYVYKPGDPEKRYFLAEWATRLMTLDQYMSEQNLLTAYSQTRGKAISEFSDFVDINKPMAALKLDTTLTRSVSIRSISFVQDGAALIRASLETRTAASPNAQTKNVIMTIHYSIIAPKTQL